MKPGPKTIEIEWEKVDQLARIHCTHEEVASVLNCSVETLQRRCKDDHDEEFAEYYRRKREGGKASLRRRQWNMAETNPAMAIWLGKQYLGQTDNQKIEQTAVNVNLDAQVDLSSLTDDELDTIETLLSKARGANAG